MKKIQKLLPSKHLWIGLIGIYLLGAPVPASWANHVHMEGGPFLGVVVAVAVDPVNTENLYCAAYGGGVFRSGDRGASWTVINRGFPNRQVFSLLIDPEDPRQLYVGTDQGIFHSRDQGASWRPLTPILKERNIRALVSQAQKPDLIFAATDQGVFQGREKKWRRMSQGLSHKDVRALAVSPRGELFAGTFGGVFKTDREPRSWAPINHGLADKQVRALAIDPASPDILYAGTASGGVFKTTNRDKGWKAINQGLLNTTVLSLVVTPFPHRGLYAGTVGGVFKSLNGGEEWSPTGQELHFTIPALAFDPREPRLLYAASGGRLFKSMNAGEKWEELSHRVNYFGPKPLVARP